MNIKLKKKGLFPFDYQLPVYNFYYPFSGEFIEGKNTLNELHSANVFPKKRALYFHIPFCDTICNFCPFTRGTYKDSKEIDNYFSALIKEIEYKVAFHSVNNLPINAIFFGGGTPSVLSADQIVKIGEIINKYFDLSLIKEFSFEIEVKSLTEEKARAMSKIGVTHPRFGLQTFSDKWRNIFNLTAELHQVYQAIDTLNKYFENISFDILYGMSGHTEEELIEDLEKSCNTGVTNIDVYPIDNVMSQPSLHNKLREYSPTSATRKLLMNGSVDTYMRSKGYMPHNGHGYRKVDNDLISSDVVYDGYIFEYHKHVYGYNDCDLVGFGSSAISIMYGLKAINTGKKNSYVRNVLEGNIEGTYRHFLFDKNLIDIRPILFHLAYFGKLSLNKVDSFMDLFQLSNKLNELKDYNLIAINDSEIKLTKVGWFNYVNIMYYLLPEIEKERLEHFISLNLDNKNKDLKEVELLFNA